MYIPRLHPNTIEEVKQRADIVDVISEYVVLRKRGKDFVGLCPFHDEKTPSFTVSPTKQMYYCFGCQASGNAIKFLMDLGKRSFAEVTLDLARRYQVPVQTLEPEQRQELQRQISLREQLFEVLASTAQFYQHALRQSADQKALQYLKSDRLLKEETIQQFGLGYAPAGWETLYRYLVDSKHYPVQLVEKAGLIKPRKEGNGYYDVFRDRLMIPIRDIQGRVIAFGGRTLTDEQPKYLNSPETELFSKGKTLFALDQAKSGISQFDQAVVVEGYFDAIALHAAGINNAVASLGTALSLEQVKLVLRYTESKQLVLNFDADKAGNNAANRAIGEIAELAYMGEVQLKILNIPDGKDADEYLHSHSPEDYRQLLSDAPLWLNWQIDQILKDRDLKQATDFQQVTQSIVKLLKNIVNNDTRNYYISYCAEILSLGDSRLIPLRVENLLTQISPANSYSQPVPLKRKAEINKASQASPSSSERGLLERAEGLLLRIYLHCPEQRQTILNALEERDLQFSLSHHRLLWQKIFELPIQQIDLISNLQDSYLESSEDLSLVSHLFHLNEKSKKDILRTPQVVQAAITCIELVMCEKRYRHFKELWEAIDEQAEADLYEYYGKAFLAEKHRYIKLNAQRNFSIEEVLKYA
ncbi:DNA primase [Calothrix sp. FACHB-1219]|uniref:DNA primase n=1 Tax=unclassified Calothrix TaxID=2619626 RepID=UPI001688889B|nr:MULTISPECIES: DNA primase [unclassified Calothrix]MBD2202155.1 DNA primase [Calothrix sp. FACHB-168]MBD2217189.1 DNA primase [Calothrix sp. FACHB-1219]